MIKLFQKTETEKYIIIKILFIKITFKKKSLLDTIVWWIPIKSLRNKIRYLLNNISVKEHNKKVLEFVKNYKILFVEIETHNRCNGDCPFCPVSVGNDIRKYKQMSIELFTKIINDFSSMNYDGIFSLYSNNECLLDKRMPIFFKMAKEKLPNAYHVIFTNGSVLTVDLLKEIFPYLDAIGIDNYNDNYELNPNVKEVYEFLQENKEYQDKVKIIMRLKNEVITNRAGQSPNKKGKIKTLKKLCVLPFCQFVIRPDGKISLCCNDSYGKMTLGDLNNQTVSEIWNSDIYMQIRKLSIKGRKYLNMCKFCDYDESSTNHINRVYESLVLKGGIKEVQRKIMINIPNEIRRKNEN